MEHTHSSKELDWHITRTDMYGSRAGDGMTFTILSKMVCKEYGLSVSGRNIDRVHRIAIHFDFTKSFESINNMIWNWEVA